MTSKDQNIHALSSPAPGEAGRTGDWRDQKPIIDKTKCVPSIKGQSACFLCWLFCPDGVISMTIPVKINMEYCKGCGICAEECPSKAITMVKEEAEDE